MWKRASTLLWSWGQRCSPIFPVRTSFPPITSGISTVSAAMDLRRALSAAFSGEPGR